MPERKDFNVHIGDALTVLKSIDDNSIHCCVTSPPYFGLRDYNHSNQIGQENTPEEYVERLVSIFHEVNRVLRPDGTFWLNIGDTYATGCGGSGTTSQMQRNNKGTNIAPRKSHRTGNLKTKDLIGIPWMTAFALRADGWYLRSEIIWSKPNLMPESVKDRPTKSHEQIFLFTKSSKYYFNTIQEPAKSKWYSGYRNKRTVWEIPPAGSDGHFAVFPWEIPHLCISAGTSDYGCCEKCGKCCDKNGPTCGHKDQIVPCRVLDVFSGSGTTGIVAVASKRIYTGIELNKEYVAIGNSKFDQLIDNLSVKLTPKIYKTLDDIFEEEADSALAIPNTTVI
jgi:DNA modification methylase